MTATQTAAPVEPSAWLRGRIAERVARVRCLGLDPDRPDPLIIAPLGRSGAPGEPSDFECDRCQTVVTGGERWVLVKLPARRGLVLVGGLCGPCSDREGWSK